MLTDSDEASFSKNDLDIVIIEPEDYIVIDLADIIDLTFLGNNDPAFMENEVVRLTNIERQKHELKPLTKNDALCRSALLHTMDMAENHFISHDGSDGGSLEIRIKRLGYNQFRMIGENLAMGHSDPASVVQGWMDSPGHRANILKPEFDQIGVAYIEGDVPTADSRRYIKGGYWTQHFGAIQSIGAYFGL